MICTILVFASCAHNSKDSSGASKDKKIIIDIMDVQVDGVDLKIPIKVRCIEGYTSATLQIGDLYKTLVCENGGFNYMHILPMKTLKDSRLKKKDYVLRVRGFHEEKKSETLTQSLVIISNKDFQSKLVVNQSLVNVYQMEGIFSDLTAYGQCKTGSTMEIEIFDDIRGVSLEEETIPCADTGFNYSSRRPGKMKIGMRLLIREMKGEKPISSSEVHLFN